MNDHPIMQDRRETAQAALAAFQALPGRDGDDLTDIGDLIVNLLHLADSHGMNSAEDFLRTQLGHYEAEKSPDDMEESARALYGR